MEFYRENKHGDYLCVNTNAVHFSANKKMMSGRAVCIAGLPNSMNTCSMSQGYLDEDCTKVEKKDVPSVYYEWFMLEEKQDG